MNFDSVLNQLGRIADLSDEDRSALAKISRTEVRVPAGKNLVKEGTRPTECGILLEGFACRYKMTANGGRQIVSFHIRGEMLDLQHLLLRRADHDVQTITAATIAWVAGRDLIELVRARPSLGEALWKNTLIEASIFREWVLNVGRRNAKARIAHMLCEFLIRCEAAGLGSIGSCDLPMTQEQIGDATGLTSVHVNRMMRELAGDGVIERVGKKLRISNWARLKQEADFDSAYLH